MPEPERRWVEVSRRVLGSGATQVVVSLPNLARLTVTVPATHLTDEAIADAVDAAVRTHRTGEGRL